MQETQTILEKNIEAVITYKWYLLNLIEELDKEDYLYPDVITDIFFDQSVKGEQILGVQKNGRDWYFNSRYDSEAAVERWIQGFHADETYGTAVVVGMANLRYLSALRTKYPKIRILVYEPDKFIWGKILTETDMTELISDFKMDFVVGQIGQLYLKELLGMYIDYANYKYMQLMICPNYDKVYEKECQMIKNIGYERVDSIMVGRNTKYRFNANYPVNRCVNGYDCIRQYNATDIVKKFQDIDFSKVPAILVSAGPSLDKNISFLKKAKGKAFIIGVDTAIPALVNADIMPDMTVTIDPAKWIQVLYEDDRVKQIPLLMPFDANREILNYHQGKRFYFYSNYRFMHELLKKYRKEYLTLETAGSVANNAFSFLRKAGFQNIILIGQDLAYTEDKVHSDNSYGELKDNHVSTVGGTFVVSDIYGNEVKTDYSMYSYCRWFEDQIRLHQDIHVIDATEGGAKIEGTEILTLEEAIDRECQSEGLINFVEKINSVEKAFSEKELTEVQDYLLEVLEDMKGKVPNKLEDAKRAYQKLQELNIKRKYTGSSFANALQKVSEYNQWMTETVEVDMLSMFSDEESYDVMEHIFSKQEEQYEQIKLIVDSGLKMIEAYKKGAELFVQHMTWVKENMIDVDRSQNEVLP